MEFGLDRFLGGFCSGGFGRRAPLVKTRLAALELEEDVVVTGKIEGISKFHCFFKIKAISCTCTCGRRACLANRID